MKTLAAILLVGLSVSAAAAQESTGKYEATVAKGLAWLVKQQAEDGTWSADGHNSTATTALAGMALLADGNTLTQGKYAGNLRRAVAWFHNQQPANERYRGVLGDMDSPGNAGRYMVQHGVALSFLAQVFEEADGNERAPLQKLLQGAVAFSVAGQTAHGGWFYTSGIEGHDASENVATTLQLQGLIDARNAGLPVPRLPLQRAHQLLQRSTTLRGGIAYSGGAAGKGPPAGGERPTITAMALAAFLPQHARLDDTTRRWLAFCADDKAFTLNDLSRPPDLLGHFYFSKVVFRLEEETWRSAFPGKKRPDHLTWSKYHTALFDHLQRTQEDDGSWPKRAWSTGPVFEACLTLNILLCEKSHRVSLSR